MLRRTMLRPRDRLGQWLEGDRQYQREMLLALLAYAAVLVPVTIVMDAYSDAGWRWAIAWLPMVPCAFAVLAWVRLYRRLDELQRVIELEALAFAFGGTVLITFGYGFLQAAGAPDISWFAVWPIMAVLWIAGGRLAKRRYS